MQEVICFPLWLQFMETIYTARKQADFKLENQMKFTIVAVIPVNTEHTN